MTTPLPHLDGPPHLQMAPAVFPDDFDPDTVPRYPVVVLEVTALPDPTVEGYAVHLNGQPVPVPAVEDSAAEPDSSLQHAFHTAVTAAARFIHQRGWAAARVNAVGPDGERWPMIIGRHGEQHDLTTPAAPSRPRWFLPAVVALVVVALVVAAVVVALRPTASTTVAAGPPTARPTAQPAELPVLPPAGYSTHARWAYGPLATPQSLAVRPAGVLLRSSEQLTLLDPTTGQPRWSTDITGSTTGPWSATIDGVPAAVTVDNGTLTWRPWTDLNQVHTVTLAENATATHLPGGMLITLPDQRAQLLTATGTTDRLIPAGATVAGIDGTVLWASNGRQLWRLDRAASQTPTPTTLRPPAAGAQPSTRPPVWKAGRLLTLWTVPAAGNIPSRTYAALHESRGTLVKAFPLDGATLAADQLGSPRYTAAGGRHLVDHQTARLITLPENWQTTALVGDHAFGLIGDRASRYTLTTGTVLTGDTAAQATPVAVVDGDALAVAALSTGPRLYKLAPAR